MLVQYQCIYRKTENTLILFIEYIEIKKHENLVTTKILNDQKDSKQFKTHASAWRQLSLQPHEFVLPFKQNSEATGNIFLG